MSSSPTAHLGRSHDLSVKVARVFLTRMKLAQERFTERMQNAFAEHVAGLFAKPTTPWDAWIGWCRYAVDVAQRSVLFWDTLRQRGNWKYDDFQKSIDRATSTPWGKEVCRGF